MLTSVLSLLCNLRLIMHQPFCFCIFYRSVRFRLSLSPSLYACLFVPIRPSFIFLSICLTFCPPIRMSFHLSVCPLSVWPSVRLSHLVRCLFYVELFLLFAISQVLKWFPISKKNLTEEFPFSFSQ